MLPSLSLSPVSFVESFFLLLCPLDTRPLQAFLCAAGSTHCAVGVQQWWLRVECSAWDTSAAAAAQVDGTKMALGVGNLVPSFRQYTLTERAKFLFLSVLR